MILDDPEFTGAVEGKIRGEKANAESAVHAAAHIEQQEQMKKIWAGTRDLVFRQQGEKRSALSQEREQAVLALLSDAQRVKYDAVQQDYARKSEELSQEGRKAFDEARKQTRQLLTPEQAQKYDKWLQEQRERGSGAGFRGSRHRRPASGAVSRPVEEQSSPHVGE